MARVIKKVNSVLKRASQLNTLIFKRSITDMKHNFHECCEKGINEQINMEFYAAYAYLNMAYHFNHHTVSLPGFYRMFYEFSIEELEHGKKFMDYLTRRGGKLSYTDIKAPCPQDWTPASATEHALDLEKKVTQSILQLHENASKVNDQDLCDFLETEYIGEQYDALKQLADLHTQILNVGKGLGAHILDGELQKKYKPK